MFATQRNLELLKKNPVFGILMVHFKVSIFTPAFTILGTRERQRNVEYQGIVPLPIGSCCQRRQQSIHLFYKQWKKQPKNVKSEISYLKNNDRFWERHYRSMWRGVTGSSRFVLFISFEAINVSKNSGSWSLNSVFNDAEVETIRSQTNIIEALTFASTDEVPRVLCLLQDGKLLPVVKYFS